MLIPLDYMIWGNIDNTLQHTEGDPIRNINRLINGDSDIYQYGNYNVSYLIRINLLSL